MKKEELKKIAKTLYVEVGLTQAEIARQLKKSKTQINRWVKAGNWHTLKMSKELTLQNLISKTYVEINKIYLKLEEEDRVITPTESDQVAKLMASIKFVEQKADLPTYFDCCWEFLEFVRQQDVELAIEIGDYQNEFLNQKAIELSK